MKKLYSIAILALIAVAVSAKAISMPGKNRIPQGVEAFLKTAIGKKFTAEQVMSVYGKNDNVMKEEGINKRETILNETFNNLTAGSEDAPDTDNIGLWEQDAVDAVLDNKGWVPYLTFAAGGCAYLGLNPEDTSDPGYLMTPNIDTTDGYYVFTARVRNVNPAGQNYPLQYFVLDNTDGSEHMISANTRPITSEWTTISFEIGQCTACTTVMFFTWCGKLLVDDVMIEKVTYSLESPTNVACTLVDINKVKVTWDPVKSATQYKVDLLTRSGVLLKQETVSTNSLTTDVDFDPLDGIIAEVTAQNADEEGHPTRQYFDVLAPESLDAPVAKEATNVSGSGFTANWESVPMAYTYEVHSNYSHTAVADGEEYYYMDDDFSEVTADLDTPESTVMTQNGRPVLLDNYISTPGWSVYLASVSTGMIGITNAYNAIPPVLAGPADDYSLGGGKVTISGTGMSAVDDCIVTVGFAKKNALTGAYDFIKNTTQKTIEMAPNDPQPFEVTIEGGSDGNHILFKITDANKDGDMALFLGPLQIKTVLSAGESYVQERPVIKVPYTETSCDIAMPFVVGDKYEYVVNAAFGDVKSGNSNTVVVEIDAAGIQSINNEELLMNNAKYIENDKIVILKNGIKYNTNGQRLK